VGFQVTGIKIGNVAEFDWRFMRALIELELSLRVGDRVQIVGPDTDFRQIVREIKLSRERIKRGRSAQKVWVPVIQRARPGDAVVKLPPGRVDEPPPMMPIVPTPPDTQS
jgi:hypothetical protein